MDNNKIIEMLKQAYALDDLNKEEIPMITALRKKINKHEGIMSLRSKQRNTIMLNIKEIVRK